MRGRDDLFAALSRSPFRSRFHLAAKERDYLAGKGMATVLAHAEAFIASKLAPALPRNDGKQTPMRGHPVFIAQHATATCCRGCLEKWHHIPQERALTLAEQGYVRDVIAVWLEREAARPPVASKPDGNGRSDGGAGGSGPATLL